MKVWFTRPSASEVYMGGYRHVQIWLEKPSWDARPWHMEGEFFCEKTQTYLDSLHREHGWVTDRAGSTYAKPFLKQCPILFEKVWEQIYRSCHPKGAPEDFEWEDGKYSTLINDEWWEAKCKVPRKRLLIEADVITKEVRLVFPRVFDGKLSYCPIDYELDPTYAVSHQYLDEYDPRPYHPFLANPYKDRKDISFKTDRVF